MIRRSPIAVAVRHTSHQAALRQVLVWAFAVGSVFAQLVPATAKSDRLYVVIDRSYSMSQDPEPTKKATVDLGYMRTRFDAAIAMAKRRCAEALGRNEEICLVTFSDDDRQNGRSGAPTFFPVCRTASDVADVLEQAEKEARIGRTHLWDTVCDVLEKAQVQSAAYHRLSMAVFTDGLDEGSRRKPDEINRLMATLSKRGTEFIDVHVWDYVGGEVVGTQVPKPPVAATPPKPVPPPPPPAPRLSVTGGGLSRVCFTSKEIEAGVDVEFSFRVQGQNLINDLTLQLALVGSGALSAIPVRTDLLIPHKGAWLDEVRSVRVHVKSNGSARIGGHTLAPRIVAIFDGKREVAELVPIRVRIADGPSILSVDATASAIELKRGQRTSLEVTIRGNPESAGHDAEVVLPEVAGITVSCVDPNWIDAGGGRFRAKMPGEDPTDDEAGPISDTALLAPVLKIVVDISALPDIDESPRSLIITPNVKGCRESPSCRIEIRPRLAKFALVGTTASTIHEAASRLTVPCGLRVRLSADNSLAASGDRVTIDGVGIPSGVTVMLKDTLGRELSLPCEVVGSDGSFDVLMSWDSDQIKQDDLQARTTGMRLRAKPSSIGSARINPELSEVALPCISFAPTVAVAIADDWGTNQPKVVGANNPTNLSIRIDANPLALKSHPTLLIHADGLGAQHDGKPIEVAIKNAVTEQRFDLSSIQPGAVRTIRIRAEVSYGGSSKVPLAEITRQVKASKLSVDVSSSPSAEVLAFQGDWTTVGTMEFNNPTATRVELRSVIAASPSASIRLIQPTSNLDTPDPQVTLAPGRSSFGVEMLINDVLSVGAGGVAAGTIEIRPTSPDTTEIVGRSNHEFHLKPRTIEFAIHRGRRRSGETRGVWSGTTSVNADPTTGDRLSTKAPDHATGALVGRMGDVPAEIRSRAGTLKLRVAMADPTKGKSRRNPGANVTWRATGADVATLAELERDAGINVDLNGGSSAETVEVKFQPVEGFGIQPTAGRVLLRPKSGATAWLFSVFGALCALGVAWYFWPKRIPLTKRVFAISVDGAKAIELNLNPSGPSGLRVNPKSGEILGVLSGPFKPIPASGDGTEVWVVAPRKQYIELLVPPGEGVISVEQKGIDRNTPIRIENKKPICLGQARLVTCDRGESLAARSWQKVNLA